MAYKIIDDETALTIFEAIQETATRSFARYNCLRQLPKHKISGELMFYLDELLEFAQKELGQDPSESLGQVIDFGLTAWLANLDPLFQRKLGFSLDKADDAGMSSSSADDTQEDDVKASDGAEVLKLLTLKKRDIEVLTTENRRLQETVEALAAEKVALKREIAHLEQVNEELGDQAPQAQPVQGQGYQPTQGYLSDNGAQSGYMALTTHSLTISAPTTSETGQSSGAKKNRRRRKKKNTGAASRPQ